MTIDHSIRPSSTEGHSFPQLMVLPSPATTGALPHQTAKIMHDWARVAFLPYVIFTLSFRVKSLFHSCSFYFQLAYCLHFSLETALGPCCKIMRGILPHHHFCFWFRPETTYKHAGKIFSQNIFSCIGIRGYKNRKKRLTKGSRFSKRTH